MIDTSEQTSSSSHAESSFFTEQGDVDLLTINLSATVEPGLDVDTNVGDLTCRLTGALGPTGITTTPSCFLPMTVTFTHHAERGGSGVVDWQSTAREYRVTTSR